MMARDVAEYSYFRENNMKNYLLDQKKKFKKSSITFRSRNFNDLISFVIKVARFAFFKTLSF